MPKVSINLCCYNGEAFLEETLESIRSQTYKNWELVVVNDGSTDSTEEIINSYMAEGLPITYHSQRNAGVASARNRALALSQGELIAFIDQDDIWLPEKLARQVPLFDDQVGLVFSDAIYFNEEGRQTRLYQNRTVSTGYVFRDLLANYFLCLSTVIVTRRALEGLSHHFDARFQIAEEADVFCRIAYSWQCRYVPEPLVRYRVHSASVSWRRLELAPRESELLLEKFSQCFPDFHVTFCKQITALKQVIEYEYAKANLLRGNPKAARQHLARIVFKDPRFAALYLLTLLPSYAAKRLLRLKKIVPS